jgi:hypothetical protein
VLPKGEAEKRKFIASTEGDKVAFRMGKLGDKDVYRVYIPIVSKMRAGERGFHKLVVLGKKPEGVPIIEGPGSAYKTATVISGELRKAIEDDIGAVTVRLSPASGGKKGVKLLFRPDTDNQAPKISERQAAISEERAAIEQRRALRLTQRAAFRITPKTPRLV